MQSYYRRTNNISGYFFQGLKNSKYISEYVSMDGCSGKESFSHLPIETLKMKDRLLFDSNMKIEAFFKARNFVLHETNKEQ